MHTNNTRIISATIITADSRTRYPKAGLNETLKPVSAWYKSGKIRIFEDGQQVAQVDKPIIYSPSGESPGSHWKGTINGKACTLHVLMLMDGGDKVMIPPSPLQSQRDPR